MVNLQAELESFKAQATQGYGDGFLTSNPQKEKGERLTPYMQDGQLFCQPEMASNSSVKSESHLFSTNDCFTSVSTPYSEGYASDLCMPDYNSNLSCNMQGSGYHDMDDLQSVAFSYLNKA